MSLIGKTVSNYQILSKIGAGGMASVYLADDLKHGRRVAIKVMNADIGATVGTSRFLREIEIAARLTHPHILPLHDSGVIDDQPYYVMPYIEGESLRQRIIKHKSHYLADCELILANCTDSLRLYKQSLALAHAIGDKVEISFEVQGVAMSLAGMAEAKPTNLDEAKLAIQLAGAVKAEWDRLGVDIHVRFWDALLDHYLGAAKQVLGKEASEAEWNKGRELSFDDAVRLALVR